MKVLLTGANGQIGYELARSLQPLGEVAALTREDLDLCDVAALRVCVEDLRPDLIVNAAGYTNVDGAESETEIAEQTNATAPGVLAECAKKHGAAIIHYSTDYVFDGNKAAAYTPDDEPNPINAYGRSKLAGEQAVLDSGVEAMVLRLSWVYGARGKNFFRTMLEQANLRDELRVVDDQHGCPTWSRLVADWTHDIVNIALDGDRSFGDHSGVHHLACSGCTHWCGFAKKIFESSELADPPDVIAIPSSEYPTAARRPQNSALDSSATFERFNLTPVRWDIAVPMVAGEWRENAAQTTQNAAQ